MMMGMPMPKNYLRKSKEPEQEQDVA